MGFAPTQWVYHGRIRAAADFGTTALNVGVGGGETTPALDVFQPIGDANAVAAATAAPATFEPVVNVPALSAFLLITFVFSLLQIRINAVAQASTRRSAALQSLRDLKSLQLSDENYRPSAEAVSRAVSEYEDALRGEMALRTIVPGIARIVAPNDPKREEKELAAARQFLGLDINDEGELVPEGKNGFRRTSEADTSKEAGMSNAAKAVLLAVALTQIALLGLLTLDPMANDVFTAIGGEPPSDIPLTSW